MPQIVEEVSIFHNILKERVLHDAVLPIEEATVNLAMDVIGRVVL